MKKIDNKGFTLVELLAVLVILVAIMSIAIPTINSSLERSKKSQNKQLEKLIGSACSLYVSEHKNNLDNYSCINVSTLINEKYIREDDVIDSEGNSLKDGCVDIDTFEYAVYCGGMCK